MVSLYMPHPSRQEGLLCFRRSHYTPNTVGFKYSQFQSQLDFGMPWLEALYGTWTAVTLLIAVLFFGELGSLLNTHDNVALFLCLAKARNVLLPANSFQSQNYCGSSPLVAHLFNLFLGQSSEIPN